MLARLLYCDNRGQLAAVEVPPWGGVLGSAGGLIPCPPELLARYHCRVALRWCVEDLGSGRVTSVNEQPLQSDARLLKRGDLIRCDQVAVRFDGDAGSIDNYLQQQLRPAAPPATIAASLPQPQAPAAPAAELVALQERLKDAERLLREEDVLRRQLEQQLEQQVGEVTRLRAELADEQRPAARLAALEEERDRLRGERRSLESLLEASQEQVRELRAAQAQQEERLQQQDQALGLLTTQAKDAAERAAQLETTEEGLRRERFNLQQELEDHRSRIRGLEREQREQERLHDEVKKLQQEIVALQDHTRRRLEAAEKDVQRERARATEAEALRGRLTDAEAERAQQQRQILTGQQALAEEQERVAELRRLLADQRGEGVLILELERSLTELRRARVAQS